MRIKTGAVDVSGWIKKPYCEMQSRLYSYKIHQNSLGLIQKRSILWSPLLVRIFITRRKIDFAYIITL